MNKLMIVLALGLVLAATVTDARRAGCGGRWAACCPGAICHGHLVCRGGRCNNAGPVGNQFGPVGGPVGHRPFGGQQPFGFPGVGGFGIPFGPTANANINGGGLSQIAAGTSQTQGSGTTLASGLNGGLAAVNGLSNTAVQGFGPAAGQVNIGGNANLQNPFGFPSGTTGNGAAGFLAGGGPSSGHANSNFNAFANPLASGGSVNTHTGATSFGGAGSFTQFGLSSNHG